MGAQGCLLTWGRCRHTSGFRLSREKRWLFGHTARKEEIKHQHFLGKAKGFPLTFRTARPTERVEPRRPRAGRLRAGGGAQGCPE